MPGEGMEEVAPFWKRLLGFGGGLFLGAILLLGGLAKAMDPVAFAEQIQVENLDFLVSASAVAFVALGLEIGLGAGLLLGVRRLVVLVPTALLVGFFLFLTGRSYWNFARRIEDEAVSCGCFGNLVDRTPSEAFWQDLMLMVPALLLAFLGRPRQRAPWRRIAIAAAAAVGALSFAWRAPALPLDDVATRLRPGRSVRDICTGRDESRLCLDSLIPELAQGDHVVVIAGLSPEFGEAVRGLNKYSSEGRGPMLWALSSSSPEERLQFFWRWAPAFEVREAPRSLLRPLYRALPRSFLVSEGRVIRTFSGLPPLERIASK